MPESCFTFRCLIECFRPKHKSPVDYGSKKLTENAEQRYATIIIWVTCRSFFSKRELNNITRYGKRIWEPYLKNSGIRLSVPADLLFLRFAILSKISVSVICGFKISSIRISVFFIKIYINISTCITTEEKLGTTGFSCFKVRQNDFGNLMHSSSLVFIEMRYSVFLSLHIFV